jgi:hypothetical protein
MQDKAVTSRDVSPRGPIKSQGLYENNPNITNYNVSLQKRVSFLSLEERIFYSVDLYQLNVNLILRILHSLLLSR